jgi:hypothetical protein
MVTTVVNGRASLSTRGTHWTHGRHDAPDSPAHRTAAAGTRPTEGVNTLGQVGNWPCDQFSGGAVLSRTVRVVAISNPT